MRSINSHVGLLSVLSVEIPSGTEIEKIFHSWKPFVGKTTEKINFIFFVQIFVENKTISARLSSLLSLDKREGGGGVRLG